jgi:hypothetical protein
MQDGCKTGAKPTSAPLTSAGIAFSHDQSLLASPDYSNTWAYAAIYAMDATTKTSFSRLNIFPDRATTRVTGKKVTDGDFTSQYTSRTVPKEASSHKLKSLWPYQANSRATGPDGTATNSGECVYVEKPDDGPFIWQRPLLAPHSAVATPTSLSSAHSPPKAQHGCPAQRYAHRP